MAITTQIWAIRRMAWKVWNIFSSPCQHILRLVHQDPHWFIFLRIVFLLAVALRAVHRSGATPRRHPLAWIGKNIDHGWFVRNIGWLPCECVVFFVYTEHSFVNYAHKRDHSQLHFIRETKLISKKPKRHMIKHALIYLGTLGNNNKKIEWNRREEKKTHHWRANIV